MIHHRHGKDDDYHQDKGQHTARVHIQALVVIGVDGVSDEVETAQTGCDHETGGGGDEDHRDPRDHPRDRQGKDHPPKELPSVAAQIPPRFQNGFGDLGKHGVKGKHHKGKVIVHNADDHGDPGVVNGIGFPTEDMVEHPFRHQDHFQRANAQNKIHPHGEHHQDICHPLSPGRHSGHEKGEGIGDHKANDGGQKGDAEGIHVHGFIHGDMPEVFQPERAVVSRESVVDHHAQRDHGECCHPNKIGQKELL